VLPARLLLEFLQRCSIFDRSQFSYDEKTDRFRCPAQQILSRKQIQPNKKRVVYVASAQACGSCWLKSQCTNSPRFVQRHLYEGALQRMQQRASAEMMRLRRLHRGASLRRAQVPHLGTSAIPATRSRESAGRDEPGNLGLQPETHAEDGWAELPSGQATSGMLKIPCSLCASRDSQQPLKRPLYPFR